MSISDRRVHIRIRLIQGGKFRPESIHALRRAHIDERLHRLGAVLRELTDTETVIVTALQIELHHQHMAVVQPAEIIVVVPLRNVAQQRPVDLARLRGGQLHRLARPVQTEIAAAPRAGMAARNQTLLAAPPRY